MHQIQIPILPISERSTWEDLPELFETAFTFWEEQTGSAVPVMLFEPHPEQRIPGNPPVVSESPNELLVVAIEKSVRDATFEALKRVEAREPEYPEIGPAKALKFKHNTPVKSFFRQMTDMPATVFSVTLPDDGPDAISIFFLRTEFTVSEFRREIQQPIG